MLRTVNIVCALCMLLAIAALLSAGLFGHFAPAPTPADPVAKVVDFYRQYGHRILLFAFFNCIAAALLLPAFCALTAAMLRMQPRSVTLAVLQITGGIVGTVGPFLGSLFLAAAVVRHDGSPYVLASLTDLAVIFIELSTLPALMQGLSLAAAIYNDRSRPRVLPLWFGWTSGAWGIMAQGGMLAIFFETGPLSSTGFIGIVLPIVSLLVWMAATTVVLVRMGPEAGRSPA